MERFRNPTPFERRVYEALDRIPHGMVTTYRLIGAAIGCNSSQAIGQALKRNPDGPDVPCHRVIKTDLTLGGFSGRSEGDECARKRRLLKSEGVEFDAEGRLVDPARVYRFED